MHGWIGGGQRRHRPHEPPRRLAVRPVLLPAPLQHRPALGDVAGRRSCHRLPARAAATCGHHRNDVMYPWTGGAAGYGSNVTIGAHHRCPTSRRSASSATSTPSTTARSATPTTRMPIVGVELDRSGSMTGHDPRPDDDHRTRPVTKWVAATRGVSAFLQDCEVGAAAAASPTSPPGCAPSARLASQQLRLRLRSGAVRPGQGRHPDQPRRLRRRGVAALPRRRHPAGGRADRRVHPAGRGARSTGHGRAPLPQPAHRRQAHQSGRRCRRSRTAASPAPWSSRWASAPAWTSTTRPWPSMIAKGDDVDFDQVFHGENAGTIDKFYTNAVARGDRLHSRSSTRCSSCSRASTRTSRSR